MKKVIIMMMLLAPMSIYAQKFGHVDTQAIMQSLPEIAKINGELQAKAKEFENDLTAMQEELSRKYEEYDKTKSTMPQTKQQETEQELQDMYGKIQQTAQDNQQQLQQLQQEMMQPVITKVRTAIENVGKNGGYTYIFETGTAIYTGPDSKDVTSEVKAEIAKMK